ncbi:MAG: hypothetical protein R3E50_15095 [Halioglobus sp.]
MNDLHIFAQAHLAHRIVTSITVVVLQRDDVFDHIEIHLISQLSATGPGCWSTPEARFRA